MKIEDIRVANDSSVYRVMYFTAKEPSKATIKIQIIPVQSPIHCLFTTNKNAMPNSRAILTYLLVHNLWIITYG